MINGIDVLLAIIALVAIGAIWTYHAWAIRDRERREDRLVHLNLMRQAGR